MCNSFPVHCSSPCLVIAVRTGPSAFLSVTVTLSFGTIDNGLSPFARAGIAAAAFITAGLDCSMCHVRPSSVCAHASIGMVAAITFDNYHATSAWAGARADCRSPASGFLWLCIRFTFGFVIIFRIVVRWVIGCQDVDDSFGNRARPVCHGNGYVFPFSIVFADHAVETAP